MMSSPPKQPTTDICPVLAPAMMITPSSPTAGTPSIPVMKCTANSTQFTLVTIHTAKCSICDQRLKNSEKMKRCPGCGWQICEKCAKKKEEQGKDFMHGNPGMPSPRKSVIRKPLYNLRMPGESTSPSPSGGSTLKMKLESPSPAASTQMKAEIPAVMPPVTPMKRTRPKPKTLKSRGKGKKKVDLGEEDGFEKDWDSSTSDSPHKRQKTQQLAPTKDSATRMLQERRSARLVPLNSPGNPTASLRGAGTAGDNRTRHQVPAKTSIAITERKPVVNHIYPKKTKQNLDCTRNIFPGLDFLERHNDRLPPNTLVRDGPKQLDTFLEASLKFHNPRRPTAEELQALIHEKVKYNLWGPTSSADKDALEPTRDNEQHDAEKAFKKRGYEEVDRMMTDGFNAEGTAMTARQYVEAGYKKLVRDTALNNDQQGTLKQFMTEAARKYAVKFCNEQVVTVQRHTGQGLELKLNTLPAAKLLEFKKTIADEAYRLLKEFAEEAGKNFAVPAGALSCPSSAGMLAGSKFVDVNRQSPHRDSVILVREGAAAEEYSAGAGTEQNPSSTPSSYRY